ncbi:chemosensory receptor c [Plakobranchus ocellatus]|uniref:Chemosensory receptor c n=1 Tax=Plakobranchus ocellatus TaxID=259542 RepID=A0AAV4BIH6_9GAST|nr:chemosensory receptor c [Plakobranchus ocellatus]
MELSNSTSPGVPDTKQDIISESTHWIMAVTFRVCLNTVVSISAVITNIINVIVFQRMNISSCAKESFLILSISDCLVGIFGNILGVLSALRYFASAHIRNSMYALYVLLMTVGTVVNMASLLSTAVLAVVRCCSVVMPFQVKKIFTARRQRIFILLATAIMVGTNAYSLVGTQIKIATNTNTNMSELVLILHPKYLQRSQYTDIYRGIIFYLSLFTVSICFVGLTIALQRSSKFRKELSSQMERNEESSRNGGSKLSQVSRREIQVIKIVILVSAVFTVTNTPAMIISVLRQTVPGLSKIGTFSRVFDLIVMCVEGLLLLSATLNIAIYLKYNTMYYTTFLEVFRRKKHMRNVQQC